MNSRQLCPLILLVFSAALICSAALTSQLRADSALELLSGFDAQRILSAYPPTGEKEAGELAKLLYRLRKADVATLSQRAGVSDAAEIGDAVKTSGRVVSTESVKVPGPLSEFLEFSEFQEITIATALDDGAEANVQIVTTSLPGEVRQGDRVEGIGIVIKFSESTPSLPSVIAAGRLQWFPAAPPSTGWKLLSQHGVDVAALASVGTRNRRPLLPEDADAFYPMLAAAKQIGDGAESPGIVKPLDLLREPTKFTGQWLTMRLNTVRVTRVSVTDPIRQDQLGGDHYFQIDAMGNLGKVVVQVERPDGKGDPVRFENTYPVSLVTAELPEFLSAQIRQQEGGDAVVSMVSVPVEIKGFFFRLWSYSSDFMDRQGAGEQFGPLVVVAQMTDRSSEEAKKNADVQVIGYIAATAIILGIIAIMIWSHLTSKEDQREQQKRRDREAETLQLPSDL